MSTKPLLITLVLAGLSALAVFVVPHHTYPEHSFKPRTLWEIVKPVFAGDLPRGAGPLTALFVFMLLGMFSAVYPVVLVPVIRSSLTVESAATTAPFLQRSWLIAGGVIALLGAAITMLAILVSEMSFGFGVSSASANRTLGFIAIPLFQAIISVLSLVIGASPNAARLAQELVS